MHTKDAAALVWESMRNYMEKNEIASVRQMFREIDLDNSGTT
jgi:hypothetical protein